MIGISRQSDYAARLVLHLACLEPGTRVSIPEISKTRLLPAPFTRRIVGDLVKAGILNTLRGTGGGISLARPATRISLLDILEAVEGGVVLNACLEGGKPCVFGPGCLVQRAWGDATDLLRGHLASVTFDTLVGASPDHQAAHAQRAAQAQTPTRRSIPLS
ncbi:MAG: Rrf2 family transcriptional regulator [Holophagaceae bacterium]